jgi:hypothetical protein
MNVIGGIRQYGVKGAIACGSQYASSGAATQYVFHCFAANRIDSACDGSRVANVAVWLASAIKMPDRPDMFVFAETA